MGRYRIRKKVLEMPAVVQKVQTRTREQRLARLNELSAKITRATEEAGITYEELEKATLEMNKEIRKNRREKSLYPFKSST